MATQQRDSEDPTPAPPPGRPSRLLVPLGLDESADRAVGPAAALAAGLGCPLTLFAWHWDDDTAGALRGRLTTLSEGLDPSPEVEIARTEDRSAAGPLLEAARRAPGTMICMATHARSGVGATILGSVAEDVLRGTTEPVLLVGPHVDAVRLGASAPIVVCVDGSDIAEEAVPMAASFADALDLPLEVVTVVDPDAAGAPPDTVESGYVAGLAAGVGPTAAWEVLHSADPASAIDDHARGRAALLALATHGRTGLARVVAGSVALRIVHEAPCPVLAIRPVRLH